MSASAGIAAAVVRRRVSAQKGRRRALESRVETRFPCQLLAATSAGYVIPSVCRVLASKPHLGPGRTGAGRRACGVLEKYVSVRGRKWPGAEPNGPPLAVSALKGLPKSDTRERAM